RGPGQEASGNDTGKRPPELQGATSEEKDADGHQEGSDRDERPGRRGRGCCLRSRRKKVEDHGEDGYGDQHDGRPTYRRREDPSQEAQSRGQEELEEGGDDDEGAQQGQASGRDRRDADGDE